MAISPSSSVRRARAALVQRLREIRLDAGLTARALALAAGWHESKVSRIEHVRTPPSDADIRLWCQICGADDQAADLIASSRATDSMYTEWRRLEVTGLRHLQESLVPLYEQTTRFRAYQSHVVPGLFQTPAYAAALLSAITAFRGIPDDSERAADARLERSRILYNQDHQFDVVIEEAVLRYQVGNAEVMAGQLGHLLSVTSMPTVSIGVLAEIYATDVLCPLDLADHESLPQQDRLLLLRRPRAATPFGERLVALMEARGLSAAETARPVSCSAGYLCNVIHGRKRLSRRLAARLDDLLEAGGELVTLAETAEIAASDDEPSAPGNAPGQAHDTRAAMTEGMSLSLPYVPGRLVIEISDPAANTGQVTPGTDYQEPVTGQLALVQDLPRQSHRVSSG
jgi:transcriptional regulator with XRE-family HTH domain/plasmid maintenance system antidote protein VapI